MWSSCRSSSSTICSYIVDRSLIPNVWGRANVLKVTRDEGLVLVKMKEIHTKKNRIGFAVLPFYRSSIAISGIITDMRLGIPKESTMKQKGPLDTVLQMGFSCVFSLPMPKP